MSFIKYELFSNPLGMAIPIQKLLCDLIHGQDRVLWPPLRGRWKDTISRNMVNSCAASARQSQDLLCATDVGSTHGSVGVNQVDSGTSVNNHVEIGCQLIKVFFRKPEALSAQVSGHHINPIHNGRIPNSQVKEVLANYKIPQEMKVVDSIPRNAMGKINKKALVNQIWGENVEKVNGGESSGAVVLPNGSV